MGFGRKWFIYAWSLQALPGTYLPPGNTGGRDAPEADDTDVMQPPPVAFFSIASIYTVEI